MTCWHKWSTWEMKDFHNAYRGLDGFIYGGAVDQYRRCEKCGKYQTDVQRFYHSLDDK